MLGMIHNIIVAKRETQQATDIENNNYRSTLEGLKSYVQ